MFVDVEMILDRKQKLMLKEQWSHEVWTVGTRTRPEALGSLMRGHN